MGVTDEGIGIPAWQQALEQVAGVTEEAVVVTDADLDPPGPTIRYVNPAFERLTGYRRDEVVGHAPRFLQGPDTDHRVTARMRAALDQDQPFEGSIVNYRKDGSPYLIQWRVYPYGDTPGRASGYVSLQRLVAAPAMDEWSAPEAFHEELFEQHAVPMLLLDPDNGDIVDGNRAAASYYGYTRDALRRVSLHQLNLLEPQETREKLRQFRHDREASLTVERHRHAGGETSLVEVHLSPLTLAGREYLHAIVHDISDRERLAEELRQRETIDPPSGLPNQVAFRDALKACWALNAEQDAVVAAVLVRATDLDEIVDVTGIAGADRTMGLLGERLREQCPEIRGVYRFSNAELGVLIEAPDHAALQHIVACIHESAGHTLEVEDAPIRLEPVLGIGHAGGTPPSGPEELIWRARVALRRAVIDERDWVSYEPALEPGPQSTVQLIARAGAALDTGEFALHYQPKIRLADGRPVGAEALIRWQPEGEAAIAPGLFMPKLEQTSLIDRFTRFVIDTAIAYVNAGHLAPVAVNFAARNFSDSRLIDDLLARLEAADVAPERVEIEVTESAFLRDAEDTIEQLHRLSAARLGVSIDDFGTGYASFAYLRRIPASSLKIDRAFVRPLVGERKTRRLLQAMIEAGHALGMSIIAEGVESAEQADILRELGCDYAQGFLWSPALPANELRAWLDSGDA